jgi:hypothetical protein
MSSGFPLRMLKASGPRLIHSRFVTFQCYARACREMAGEAARCRLPISNAAAGSTVKMLSTWIKQSFTTIKLCWNLLRVRHSLCSLYNLKAIDMGDSWEEQADEVSPATTAKPSFSFNPQAASFSFNPTASSFTPPSGAPDQAAEKPEDSPQPEEDNNTSENKATNAG